MARVFVGISGGVDSAVSAALLKEKGYAVTGVFIKIWQPEFIECTWREDRLEAMRVCAALGIAFQEIDLSAEYKSAVVDTMVNDYMRGVTPNPDVLCNTFVKFGVFLKWALVEGAQAVATGHYARVQNHSGTYSLLRGCDPEKDQSYFLHQLTQEQLKHALFPVGEMPKTRVRSEAVRFKLPNAKRPDSQGLCFIGDVSMRDFLKRYIDLKKGEVVNVEGAVIGEHDGAALYTVGERHGFRVRGAGVWYVSAVDVARNRIVVANSPVSIMRSAIQLLQPTWTIDEPSFPRMCSVQVRYRGEIISARIERTASDYRAQLDAPQIASAGQSMVFYDGDKCLGGAVMR